ncbi:glycoside hydrolase family 3 C-terminal domain-containing protein [Microbacterium amylolyticum]|uniref:Beta-glucosidase n=1 Tax=Microbacterium amylolyticum TaxID=936337 RepID=A0ABS4ZDR8_9MICO|nr:glycoside hydrolase family 3 C-terminal domain-containing protein [Microbacterium amylolyticum]MBP2435431.1 beta-glucosidase [Microbacterium amylolyticum]
MSTDDLIAQLSLFEKAALLSGENTWQTRAIPRLGIESIFLSDGPHGVRKQTGSGDHLGIAASLPATCFPTAATVANSWDASLAEDIGTALGREASEQGVHVLLGPGLNIKRSPLGGRSFEYFSEDPEVAGVMAAAYVRGIQSQHVAATPKHFAANSQELRRMASDSILDERTLREIYLSAFETVVREAKPWAIMSAYNRVCGEYAHENPHLLQDVLRDEWGFDGAVISDWGGSNDAVRAVAAGGTLEMPSPGFTSARDIVSAVEQGVLAENDLDQRVAELLDLITRVTQRPSPGGVDQASHHALARRAASESAVLLRNQDGILPLAEGTDVAFIGEFATVPRYQGAGSSLVNATNVTNLVAAARSSSLSVSAYAQGFRRDGTPDDVLIAEAVRAAAVAEVAIVCLGLPENAESEGLDRETLSIPGNQIELLRAVSAVNNRVVVIISAGGAVEMPWADGTPAVIHAYLGGQAGAEGLVDVLTGTVTPSGKLAETLPRTLGDTPTARDFPATGPAAEYREGPFVGYRYYETADIDVAFEFGFGLSYTTFSYRDISVSESEVTFSIENTGTFTGAEIAQVYVARHGDSSVVRPVSELRGFAKVRLEPGEARTLSIPLGERAFRFYDVETQTWQVEAGTYEIRVGASVRDIRLAAAMEIAGTVPAGVLRTELSPYLTADIAHIDNRAFSALLGREHGSSVDGGAILANDPVLRLEHSDSPVGRLIFRLLDGRRRAAARKGTADLNMLFLLNMPFRAIGKMSGGRATDDLVEGVLRLANGKTIRGLWHIMRAYARGRRAEKQSQRIFANKSGGRA